VTTNPVRIDRLQAGLVAAIARVLPDALVLWAPSAFPRGAAPDLLMQCRLLAGPDTSTRGGDTRTPATLPTSVRFRIVATSNGDAAALFLSGRKFERTFVTGETVTEARDAWLALLADEPMVDATFTADGTDAIVIDALELGDLYDVAARGSAPNLVALDVLADQRCVIQVEDVTSYVEIQAFSMARYAMDGAARRLSQLRSRMMLPTVADTLESFGLGIVGVPGRVVSLDSMSGPQWQSRSAITLYVSQISIAAELGPTIDRARGTIVVRGTPVAPHETTIDVDTEPPT